MSANKVLMALVVLSVLVASVIAACGAAPEDPVEEPVSIDGEVLLQERCTDCTVWIG